MNDTETYLQYLSGDFIQIRSSNGTRVITLTRLAEIFAESCRIGRRARGGTKEECRAVFDRLIEQEIAVT